MVCRSGSEARRALGGPTSIGGRRRSELPWRRRWRRPRRCRWWRAGTTSTPTVSSTGAARRRSRVRRRRWSSSSQVRRAVTGNAADDPASMNGLTPRARADDVGRHELEDVARRIPKERQTAKLVDDQQLRWRDTAEPAVAPCPLHAPGTVRRFGRQSAGSCLPHRGGVKDGSSRHRARAMTAALAHAGTLSAAGLRRTCRIRPMVD